MAGPKVAVIGAGSYFFGKPIIHKMATSDVMAGGTLALVDTDPAVLRTMAALARRVFKHTRCGVKVVASTDRRKVLRNCDFVVLSFSRRNAHYRGVDTQIALKRGIRMCRIGPGGIFRALREAPVVLDVARNCRKLCPNAWLINFVNPTTVLGMALQRHAPDIRSFALCDGNHEPFNSLMFAKRVGIVPESADVLPPAVLARLEIAIAGVNQFSRSTPRFVSARWPPPGSARANTLPVNAASGRSCAPSTTTTPPTSSKACGAAWASRITLTRPIAAP